MSMLHLDPEKVTKEKMIVMANYFFCKLETVIVLPCMDTSDFLVLPHSLYGLAFNLSWPSGRYNIEMWIHTYRDDRVVLVLDAYDRNPDDPHGNCLETYRYVLNGYDFLRFGIAEVV